MRGINVIIIIIIIIKGPTQVKGPTEVNFKLGRQKAGMVYSVSG